MLRRTVPLACTVLLALGCQAQEDTASGAAPAPVETAAASESPVVARIGDSAITAAELDEHIKNALFDRQTAGGNPTKLYELRSPALEEMVMERVLEQAAQERGVTIEALIQDEIGKKGEVTDEEVAAFYTEKEDQMGGRSLEEMTPRIRDYLTETRAQEVAHELLTAANAEILLERPRVEVAADGPSRGPEDAVVTIVEFSDFQCPFCSRALPVVEELLERYPEDVRFVYRHMPLDRIHPRARAAAEASLCADEQDGFWAYHDLLFANARTLEDADLKRLAEEAGLDVAAFEACLGSDAVKAKVDADIEAARSIGVTGTPAFVVNGVVLSGAQPVEEFVAIIDGEIERAKGSGSS